MPHSVVLPGTLKRFMHHSIPHGLTHAPLANCPQATTLEHLGRVSRLVRHLSSKPF